MVHALAKYAFYELTGTDCFCLSNLLKLIKYINIVRKTLLTKILCYFHYTLLKLHILLIIFFVIINVRHLFFSIFLFFWLQKLMSLLKYSYIKYLHVYYKIYIFVNGVILMINKTALKINCLFFKSLLFPRIFMHNTANKDKFSRKNLLYSKVWQFMKLKLYFVFFVVWQISRLFSYNTLFVAFLSWKRVLIILFYGCFIHRLSYLEF